MDIKFTKQKLKYLQDCINLVNHLPQDGVKKLRDVSSTEEMMRLCWEIYSILFGNSSYMTTKGDVKLNDLGLKRMKSYLKNTIIEICKNYQAT
jgi:hypothetical protein